jgi:ribosomal protein L13E
VTCENANSGTRWTLSGLTLKVAARVRIPLGVLVEVRRGSVGEAVLERATEWSEDLAGEGGE